MRVGSGPSDDWCYHTPDQRRAPTCPSIALARVDLTSLGGLDDLGLVAVGPGRADRRPRLHGQHRQTSWCLLAHGQYRRPGCRGRAARTRPAMRWEGVRVIGVDEHVWRRAGGRPVLVTVIVDPAPVRERRGPSRARGIVPGRCEQALKTWLAGRPGSREGGRPEWWRWTGSAGRPGARPPKDYRAVFP